MPVGKSRSLLTCPLKLRFSRMRPVHSKFGGHQSLSAGLDKSKKLRSKKGNGLTKYEMLRKGAVPDYTDVAYREAVSRLRYLLNDSYTPPPPKYLVGNTKPQESDEESGVSLVVTDRTRTARLSPYKRPYFSHKPVTKPHQSAHSYDEGGSENLNMPPASELMGFIERQEEYIDQLEKEAQYCRDELSQLLGKVKELIAENESLQDQQKTSLMKGMFEGLNEDRLSDYQNSEKYRRRLEGPLIVFESRISELEAQLTQTRIDLRKAQEEAEMYRKKLEDCQPSSSNYDFYKQIENLQREKRDLNDSLAKLQASISQIREKEIDASKKVQRTLDVVDKTQFEKQQAEMEVYRLKSELELQHDKLLEVLSEQTRKVADERSQAERRYLQHVERLNAELTIQRDALSKAQMEVEKHLRIEEDLKRDLSAKNATIENIKKELNNKIASLQSELSAALSERDSLEQELNTSRMSGERTERLNKQESSRLQVEISSLRQRLDRGDAELIHCRRENLRLLEQISNLEKELTLYKIKLGEKKDPIEEEEEQAKEKLLNSRISEIESKHVERVSELEGLIENQSQVMAQLKAECQSLTQKLEESTARHKQEMENLQSTLKALNNKVESNFATGQSNLADGISQLSSSRATVTCLPSPLGPDDISKGLENKTDRLQYHLLGEERKLNGAEGNEISSQQNLEQLPQQISSSKYEEEYDQNSYQQQQPTYQVIKSNNLGSSFENSYQYGNGFEISGDDLRRENQNTAQDNQGQYSSFSNEQSNSSYQEQPSSYQDRQPGYFEPNSYKGQGSFSEQISNFQEQPSYQEQISTYQDQPSYQEHVSVYQEQPSYKEQTIIHQEQPSYQDQPLIQESLGSQESSNQKVQEESFQAQSEPAPPPPEPAFVPLATTAPETPPVEPKPTSQPSKSTSQRFQRAAELSRQASKSEESPRGKSSTQSRLRTSQSSRIQQKTPPSRFK